MRKIKELLVVGLTLFIIGCGGAGDGSSPITGGGTVIPINISDESNSEEYNIIHENIFKDAKTSPHSTFSIDVDTASYSNIRRFITINKKLPPKDAVRVEEMMNYFSYNYKEPNSSVPFIVNKSIGDTLWNKKTKIIHIGIQTKKVNFKELPATNLVFLIDVSGSMSASRKLPLLKESIKLLVEKLREKDRVSIVVYAGSSGLILDKAKGTEKRKILEALNQLTAGGVTAGGEGIDLAYKVALESFIEDGNNRVILATDGDFNVGKSSQRDLEDLIEEKRDSGVYLTVLGFGMGNLKDNKVETLADKGNGNYAYIDNLLEAKKVLVTQMGGTLYTVAKDVKIQVEFNPLNVSAYRLIGYENRRLENEEFNDDNKDAGEIGMGHSVTVLYEIKPVGKDSQSTVDNSRYQDTTYNNELKDEWATINIRYKNPKEENSKKIVNIINVKDNDIDKKDFDFVQTIAGFGMILRDSKFKEDLTINKLISVAKESKAEDKEGYRKEFIGLLEKAKLLK
jgi:Ca-activated chloride channel family protein